MTGQERFVPLKEDNDILDSAASYRHKLGLDVGLEALRDALRTIATVDEIARSAEVCRAGTVMRPYLEALAL